jgi:Zn-dependent oligopeptidase
LRSHYNYVFDNITNTYNFTTKNNILYRVAFVVDQTFSTISGEEIPNVFQIVIEKANEEIEPLDTKVSTTIENIIERFFERIENSLIYICYDVDKKARARQDVFERWYKKSDAKEKIIKIDKVIEIVINKSTKQKLFTAFLFHKKNPDCKKLLEIYNRIEEVLNAEK